MPVIPEVASREFLFGVKLWSRGKVRDTYTLNDTMLLPIATDRVSIFDFVLAAEVPQKGEVLAAMNAFWVNQLRQLCDQDAIQFGAGVDRYLPLELRRNPDVQKRAIVVRKLTMIPVEAVMRRYLTGNGWAKYQATEPNHKLCGHELPAGLKDGDRLPIPLFTPTTKAEEGHDEDIDRLVVARRFGTRFERQSLQLFAEAARIAFKRGIILADTKLELGVSPQLVGGGATADFLRLVLADERFTPDSSRFWLRKDWENSRVNGTSPTSFDKQVVREWGKTVGIHRRNPLVKEDIAYVHGLTVPKPVLLATRRRYRSIFYFLTGKHLETFQTEDMGIPTILYREEARADIKELDSLVA